MRRATDGPRLPAIISGGAVNIRLAMKDGNEHSVSKRVVPIRNVVLIRIIVVAITER